MSGDSRGPGRRQIRRARGLADRAVVRAAKDLRGVGWACAMLALLLWSAVALWAQPGEPQKLSPMAADEIKAHMMNASHSTAVKALLQQFAVQAGLLDANVSLIGDVGLGTGVQGTVQSALPWSRNPQATYSEQQWAGLQWGSEYDKFAADLRAAPPARQVQVNGQPALVDVRDATARPGGAMIRWLHDGWALASMVQMKVPAGGDENAYWQQAFDKALRDAETMDKVLFAPGGPGGIIDLVDPNPALNEKLPIFINETISAAGAEQSTRNTDLAVRCRGVAADGVTPLLVRARFAKRGKVVFSLLGSSDVPNGALYPLGGKVFGSPGAATVTAQTIVTYQLSIFTTQVQGGKEWAYAIYRSPAYFGPSPQDRHLILRAALTPQDGSPNVGAQLDFLLVRPPLVLVHGTYDNPVSCWQTPRDPNTPTFRQRMIDAGFRPYAVDWGETSGSKDPSSFHVNERAVFERPGGIASTLLDFRLIQHFAATEVDLVCHSQGGDIARAYWKGMDAREFRDKNDIHYTDGVACAKRTSGTCWYHRPDNYGQGDFHRLITVSTTHLGSDCCRVLGTYVGILDSFWKRFTDLGTQFLVLMAHRESGITEGFWDQNPGSDALQKLGQTIVPSHAIACAMNDQDMSELDNGSYMSRMVKIWTLSSKDALVKVYEQLGQHEDAVKFAQWKDEEGEALETERLKLEDQNALRMREAIFGHCPNDCTVRQESSFGGLEVKYTTTVPHVAHGVAPRFPSIQNRVIALLRNDRDDDQLFCKKGFPAALKVPELCPASSYDPEFPTPEFRTATPPTVTSAVQPPPTGTSYPDLGVQVAVAGDKAIMQNLDPQRALAKDGFVAGDTIDRIDGQPTTGLATPQVQGLLAGAPDSAMLAELTHVAEGTHFLLKVMRPQAPATPGGPVPYHAPPNLQFLPSRDAASAPVGLLFAPKEGVWVAAAVAPGSIAERAGILAGDQIDRVDGRPVAGLTSVQFLPRLWGPPGSILSVDLTRPTDNSHRSLQVVRFVPPVSATAPVPAPAAPPPGTAYGHLGIEMAVLNGKLTVVAVDPGSLAAQGGVAAADTIDRIAGQATQGMTVAQARALMFGPAGTQLILQLTHAADGHLINLTAMRRP